MDSSRQKPEWWIANEEARASMDLPEYEPPRFDDDVYVHDVVPELESTYDCEITFLGINVDYLDAWSVRVDGNEEFSVDRSRDDSGNTIYHIDSEEFIANVEDAMNGSNDDR